MSMSVPYQLGGTLTEQQRLIAQAQGLEPHARSMLDCIAIGPGSKVVDFGCGPLGILNLLSERVGSAGVVVGKCPDFHYRRPRHRSAEGRVRLCPRTADANQFAAPLLGKGCLPRCSLFSSQAEPSAFNAISAKRRSRSPTETCCGNRPSALWAGFRGG